MIKLGICNKTQYEHNGPHAKISHNGDGLPPFPCENWREISERIPSFAYEIKQDQEFTRSWRVEGLCSKTGDISVVVFDHVDAEQRARDYVEWATEKYSRPNLKSLIKQLRKMADGFDEWISKQNI